MTTIRIQRAQRDGLREGLRFALPEFLGHESIDEQLEIRHKFELIWRVLDQIGWEEDDQREWFQVTMLPADFARVLDWVMDTIRPRPDSPVDEDDVRIFAAVDSIGRELAAGQSA